MIELILLVLLLGAFVYGTLYFRKETKDEEGNGDKDFDFIFITSIVLLSSAFVFGIIFSDRFIKFIMSFSKLASIGLLLTKIKGFFISSEHKIEKDIVEMKGGSAHPIPEEHERHNNIYDDLPESDDEEEY